MKFVDLLTELEPTPHTAQPEPVNPDFVSLGELLIRLQTAQAKPLTLTQAAHILLSFGFRAGGAPAWLVNGDLGIRPLDSLLTKCAIQRLEYVFHRGQFESDGPDSGASTDYDFFGFDRQQFADFLAAQGEPLDLFCPVPDTAPATDTVTPAPVVAANDDSQKRNRKPSWAVEAMPYMQTLYKTGKFRSKAVFYKKLLATAGEQNSPFTKVDGVLYCTKAGTTVEESSLGNYWRTVRQP